MYCKTISSKSSTVENILTIDVEDWFHILGISSAPSLDVWHKLESRVLFNTLYILDILDYYQTPATFFVLGWVAENFPDLVREIEKRGHEIGTHGYGHKLIYELTPEQFKKDVEKSLEILTGLVSSPIRGYRAPGFSLTLKSLWALDILVELGIRYDASIFPMKRNHGGLPIFSDKIDWISTQKSHKIFEIPVTPVTFLGKKIYLFGGGYFRLSPLCVIKKGIEQLNYKEKPVLVYLHPREFDIKHPKLKMSYLRFFSSYINLHTVPKKFQAILSNFKFNRADKILLDSEKLVTLVEKN
jgi:polysaccharide deacetylase family protein (PEP-CTERM system associated)